jgi:hypothetical protein
LWQGSREKGRDLGWGIIFKAMHHFLWLGLPLKISLPAETKCSPHEPVGGITYSYHNAYQTKASSLENAF